MKDAMQKIAGYMLWNKNEIERSMNIETRTLCAQIQKCALLTVLRGDVRLKNIIEDPIAKITIKNV